jgi:dUTP pyrophosphatase
MTTIKFRKMHKDAKLPFYATEGAAGADLCAVLDDGFLGFTIHPGNWGLIQTGLYIEIPSGFEVQVRPRSGLALRHGITVLNAPGTIDSDYRGELAVMLINQSGTSYTIKTGDRIAQMVVAPVVRASFAQVEELSETDRGANGFGSTGFSGIAAE